jgi:CheY-like chemotaxis protein
LVDLLGNAARYTDAGGRIELCFAVTAAEVEVRVIDNGAGIDASMQRQVFEMFIQVDKSIERGRAGLGVGLALARHLVELHGGTIEVESAGLGRGSTFTIRLPRLAAAMRPAESVAAPVAASPARGLRVLIADDNGDYADSLAVMLGAAGHTVEVVYDGAAAQQAAAARPPQVGLFDIGMPALNGYELARRVRAASGGAEVLLIAITGWGQESDRQRARAAGFDHHFVKPIDIDALLALLDRQARHAPAGGG